MTGLALVSFWMRFSRRGLVGALGLAAFLLNPAACEPDFEYGAAEMLAAVEGSWRVTIQPATGPAQAFTIRLEQAAAVARTGLPGDGSWLGGRTARACGTRTLVKGAGACITATEMPLTGQVLEGDDALRTASVTGNLTVLSRVFVSGALSVRVGPYILFGRLSNAGLASNLETSIPSDTVSMLRLSRP